MAATNPQCLSSIESVLKKLTLDHGDYQCEVESSETWECIDRTTNAKSEDEESDCDLTEIEPKDYQDGLYVELCNSALAYYMDKHPGECYEFKSMKRGYWWIVWSMTYELAFCAKNLNMDDKRLQNFMASVSCHQWRGPEVRKIKKCVLLKDGVEQFEEVDNISDSMPEIPLEDLQKRGREYENAVEMCKLAVQDYQSNHPEECYEFVSLKKVKRCLSHGFEYKLVFLAKNMTLYDNPLATFQALGYHLMRAVETLDCKILE
ncbi:unnamed protein product [Cuscuta epithymum]|uniref:Uncharacterized protein n=1 Tax=Cuscuta epithymum TaxID=186058 RepID=A0AAV0E1L9_9ASTE|nr:unnamed protein product [Cuscuta epithymum]